MNLRPYLQFNRKISERLTLLLAKTSLTPNHVTAISLFFGLAAGAVFSYGSKSALLWGALFLHISFILDNCDGELARLKDQATSFGKSFDLLSDLTVDLAIWTGLAIGTARQGMFGHDVALWVLACAGSIINCFMVIRERQKGCSTSIHYKTAPNPKRQNSIFHSIFDTLCHNGDAAMLAWAMALTGNPGLFLYCSALYINCLWITRLGINYKKLLAFGRPPAAQAIPVYFQRVLRWSLKGAFLCLGVWLLVVTMKDISLAELQGLFLKAGLLLPLTFVAFPVTTFFHSLGLYYLFPVGSRRRIRIPELFAIFLAGDSINKITPFIDVAGEPLKISLFLKRDMANLEDSVRAIWVERILFILSEVVVLLAALVLLGALKPNLDFLWVGLGGILLSIISVGLLNAAQKRGLLDLIVRAVHKLKKDAPTHPTAESLIPARKGVFGFFLHHRKRDLSLSLFWNSMGWTFFTLEVYIALKILGVDLSMTAAFVVQSLLQAVKTVSFFIPGNLGAQEGGLAYLLTHFGFPAASGVALSLIKRVRQFFWAAIGAVLFLIFNSEKIRGQKAPVPVTTAV
ncbi:MAG TPA: flippase-like domain-containing protein [Candidatus Omnitrophota bacterium]|nr:flippase-like domain-containing protein [Candidatus Omnitrophota bacterium]